MLAANCGCKGVAFPSGRDVAVRAGEAALPEPKYAKDVIQLIHKGVMGAQAA